MTDTTNTNNTNTNTNANDYSGGFFDGHDFVITQTPDGEFRGGGYKINSTFLDGDQSIMTTIGNAVSSLTGGGASSAVSCPFENLVVYK